MYKSEMHKTAEQAGLALFITFAFPAFGMIAAEGLTGGGWLGILALLFAALMGWSVRYQDRISACWQAAVRTWKTVGDIDAGL